ncbi:MAG TPA: DinB family protein [Chitinophagaceae bacterium]|nr:DinB family protein [Chitinophagaceae bacterium]
MESIVLKLNTILDQYLPPLRLIPAEKFNFKPSPVKWSKKEILGHLIDSAQNNIRRFILAQYEEQPNVVYNQDKWVSISNYQDYNLPDLISLWHLLNKHIGHILQYITPEMAARRIQTEELHNVQWLAEDYIRHMLHHLHQILELEPIAYP